jgi:choline dehydrogenase-like flavoprotein
MIVDTPDLADLTRETPDVTIIGGGPLGLNVALALADRGQRVLVLESGGQTATPQTRDLAADELLTPDTHHAPDITVARRLGGASNLWGGRCVPYDPIDFKARPWLDLPDWPIEGAALEPYLQAACTALGAGGAVFSAPVPGLGSCPPEFETDRLERWSDQPRTHVLHGARLAGDPNVTVALGMTVTGMEGTEAGRITALRVHGPDGQAGSLPVRQVVLAAGGNASTRLLLNVQAAQPALFGGQDGPLGRYYMGHVNGQIADIVFADTPLHEAMDYHVDDHGSYVRRRITPTPALQEARELANVAFWPVVPEISQTAHRSGPLSAVFLALSAPGIGSRLIAEPIRLKHLGPRPWKWGAHLRNLLVDPLSTATFVPWFLWHRRYAKHRIPGFFLRNKGRRYGLEFHSEHLPQADSRMTLSQARDATGLRRLKIDFRFSQRDVDSVLAAHAALEDWLQTAGLARLEYRFAPQDRAAGVLSEARHGNHQQGTIRMGGDPAAGVVDGWGTSFDLGNLHVVSTAILPTSSQANPTLTALQLGLRLVAERLAPDTGTKEKAHA